MREKANNIFWIMVTLFMLVLTCMHPRFHNIVLFLLALLKCISCFIKRKKQEPKGLLKNTFYFLILMVWMGLIAAVFDVLIPFHAKYEYKADIQNLKMRYRQERYFHFPDEIPDCASGIQWWCAPGLMQGGHSENLFFYADREYISELYQYYAGKFPECRYTEELEWHQVNGMEVFFQNVHQISQEEMYEIRAFVTYEYLGRDRNQSGVYFNLEKGYVCYYAW